MIDHATVERRRTAVRQVREAKKALSGLMSEKEIADHLGVSAQSLRRYASDPATSAFRAIPEETLKRLRLLAGRTLLQASGTYVDVA
jgi:AraC-like DNA-binding protein